MKVFIHCGPPRTGTTSFQNLLQDIEGKFPSLIIPKAGWDPDSFGISNHRLLKYDDEYRSISLGEFKMSEKVFDEFIDILRLHQNTSVGVVVSTERFASFVWHQIPLLYERLSDFECYFVFNLRASLDMHVSIWRKRIELGWRVSFKESLKTIFSELMYMRLFLPRLLASKFGGDSVRVISYAKDPKENLLKLAEACGMGALTSDASFQNAIETQPILSESLPLAEVELIRMANEIICKDFDASVEWVPHELIDRRDVLVSQMRNSIPLIKDDFLSDLGLNDLRDLYEACEVPI